MNSPACDIAWDHILGNTADKAIQDIYRVLFGDAGRLEERQFTRLHMLILGYASGDLELSLEQDVSLINVQDDAGRTPLAWSAVRGDRGSTETLLRYGADPNICAFNGDSPLHYATMAAAPVCIEPLIHSGADVSHRNKWQQTPLHAAAIYRDDPRYFKPLLEAGADVNARGYNGASALIGASQANHARSALCLISQGADIDLRDAVYGYNALVEAVQYNSHDVLELLVQYNVGFTARWNDCETLLHRAARLGDVRTFEILRRGRIEGITGEELNSDGSSAADLLRQRKTTTADLIGAFDSLLAAANAYAQENQLEIDTENEEELFSDALENIGTSVVLV